jgi:hypothetical protein
MTTLTLQRAEQDIGGIVVLLAIFALLTWSYMRLLKGGRPLDRAQRKMFLYAFEFAAAMCLTMMLGSWFHWPTWIWFTLIAVWGVLILYIAWRRSQRKQTGAAASKAKIPYLAAGLPTVGLLVGLIGSWVEWTLVAEGSGRLGVGLLWSAGVVASIWLAGAYRHVVVMTALRAFVALAVIGAIGERSVAPAIVAAGAILVAVQRLWKPSAPSLIDLEALRGEAKATSDSSHAGNKRN